MQGIIEKVESKTGRESGTPFEIITIKGVDYTLFDNLDTFHEGDTVEFEHKESGKYKNIQSIQLIKATEASRKSAPSSQDQIRRESVLRTAVMFWELKKTDKVTEENIIETAKRFSAFVLGKDIEENSEEKLEQNDDLLQELTMLCKSEGIGIDTFNNYCQDQHICKLLQMRTETIKGMIHQWDSTVGKVKMWKTKQQES